MLALPPSDISLITEENPDGCHIFRSMAISQKQIEQAGVAYQTLCKQIAYGSEYNEKEEEEKKSSKKKKGNDDESDDEMEQQFQKDWEQKRKKRTKGSQLLTTDHYAVLGLEEIGVAASDGQIKKAYRKLALEYHPDKQVQNQQTAEDESGVEKEEGELSKEEELQKEIWLKIQDAYETLIDADKRRRHDSSLPFDDRIPDPDDTVITAENFYELFAEVFKRNSQWSKKKPVPQLGDPTTPLKKV